MPALQVRDFPEDLYSQLKACAARNHRSVAQQTIAYVEQGMMMEGGGECYWDGRRLHRPAQSSVIDFDTERERQERIERRKEIFARIRARNEGLSGPKPTSDEIVELVRECRREQDRRISDSLGLSYDEAI